MRTLFEFLGGGGVGRGGGRRRPARGDWVRERERYAPTVFVFGIYER